MGIQGQSRIGHYEDLVAELVIRAPAPPRGMHLPAVKIWRQIVSSMPQGWFTQEMFPLLAELCQVTVISCELAARLRKIDLRIEQDLARVAEYYELSRLKLDYARIISRISTQLKLTPRGQGRNNNWRGRKEEAKRVAAAGQQIEKPWEFS